MSTINIPGVMLQTVGSGLAHEKIVSVEFVDKVISVNELSGKREYEYSVKKRWLVSSDDFGETFAHLASDDTNQPKNLEKAQLQQVFQLADYFSGLGYHPPSCLFMQMERNTEQPTVLMHLGTLDKFYDRGTGQTRITIRNNENYKAGYEGGEVVVKNTNASASLDPDYDDFFENSTRELVAAFIAL